ncbi:MAG: flagellin [Acidibrevibacterium sp.]|uniref:flagellin n=1 Tax=Acidibrevibacterium sp. TaxID=2606776 RepID=UPI003D07A6AA
MSGAISSNYALAPSSYGMLGELVQGASTVQTQLDSLAQQASTGNVSQTYSGLGANALTDLNLNAEIAQNNTYVANITSANTTIGITQTVMNQLSKIASGISAQLDNITGTSISTVAEQAQNDLQQVANLLNTQNGTNYIFAGQDASNPPVPNPGNILSSPFFTQIQAAVSGLATNGAATTMATSLSVASSNTLPPGGTSPFSAALSALPLSPSPSTSNFQATVETGPGQSTSVGLLASANTYATSSGPYTTGSYTRDLMNALAMVGSLTPASTSATGFTGLISDIQTSLSGAISAMANEEGGLGATQDSLTATSTTLGNVTTALQTQLSSVQDVNMSETLSNLTMVQTQLQASYKLIASVQSLSLANYV